MKKGTLARTLIAALYLNIVMLAACNNTKSDFDDIEGPAIVSQEPNIRVETWEYLSPQQVNQIRPLPDPAGIPFGDAPHKPFIFWRKKGFDLFWVEFPCSIKPVALIKENAEIELFGGKRPENCDAMAVTHGFTVTLTATTPLPSPDQWQYSFKPSEPQP